MPLWGTRFFLELVRAFVAQRVVFPEPVIKDLDILKALLSAATSLALPEGKSKKSLR